MTNILASKPYNYLKENLLKTGCFDNINIESKTFPDGEHYFRITKPKQLFGKPAVYICGTTDDCAILEAYNVACTLVQEGCQSLHLVIPYFGYSTMERAITAGESVSAKNIARLFSSIPLSAVGNYIYMVDLHSIGTQYYFEQNIHPVHLTTDPIIDKMINDIRRKRKNVVLASADMGRAKWIEKISSRLNMSSGFIMKKRLSGIETEVVALNADVKNKDVILFDDMIRSGSSIIHAAEAYKSIGAKDIYVVCVHGIFVDGSIEKLKKSGVIKAVYCTNTHSKTQSIHGDFVKVYDISDIILKGLRI
jgi:ribose-phosphate pyrophosphokinase